MPKHTGDCGIDPTSLDACRHAHAHSTNNTASSEFSHTTKCERISIIQRNEHTLMMHSWCVCAKGSGSLFVGCVMCEKTRVNQAVDHFEITEIFGRVGNCADAHERNLLSHNLPEEQKKATQTTYHARPRTRISQHD